MKSLTRVLSSSLQLIATAAAGLLPAIAMAQEATQFVDHAPRSPLTRAEVTAELIAARANGTLMSGGEVTNIVYAAPPSTRSRAEVKAEVAQARADGTLYDGGEASPIQTAREGSADHPVEAQR